MSVSDGLAWLLVAAGAVGCWRTLLCRRARGEWQAIDERHRADRALEQRR